MAKNGSAKRKTPRITGDQRYSKKNDTYTDRNGATVSNISEKGFTRGSSAGLLASDISDLIEIRADNTRQIQDAIDKALAAALEEVGLVCEGYAKRLCPVDTGRLRNSITHVVRPSEDSVYVGTNVEYGPYVELGTSQTKKQPFLYPAAADHESTYRKILEKHLKNGA